MNTALNFEDDLILGIRNKTGFQQLEVIKINAHKDCSSVLAMLVLKHDSRVDLLCRQNHSILAKLVAQELGISQHQVGMHLSSQCINGAKCCQAIQFLSAITRCLLTRSAAHIWNISPAECTLRAGKVRQLSKDFSFELGELIGMAKELDIPQHAELRYQFEGLEI
ncbi:hypothetical protein [Reichenbachiella ulvae]|uniref:Uncharacterized protein n=1 Tax=Reichenbachiella ulvae TaxID=2980104 RepID=A0ABT3CPX8_9BACT|nr:hypothetical protein [Reichenbachiella ulvae]MCV9385707.1 hypothetical protein [Reichenbachiella ulvae]